MAASPFKRLSWQTNEATSTNKLNAMTNNDNWLYENMLRSQYWASVKRSTGLRLLAGVTYLAPNNTAKLRKNISFGSFFSAGCRPIIVTGLQGSENARTHCTFRGLSNLNPDHQGMIVTLYSPVPNARFTSGMYVNWVAIGY